jgi:hypothetical protein
MIPSSNIVVSGTNSVGEALWFGTPVRTWIGRAPSVETDAVDGEMAEVLVYSGVLDATQRAEIEAYLISKYFTVTPTEPTVSARVEGENLVIEFTGKLQYANKLPGPFVDYPGEPSSPLIITNIKSQPVRFQFFRSYNP